MATRQQAAAEILRRRREAREAETLRGFAQQAWHVLEPATQLRWGWCLDAICDHLTAVTEDEIQFLLMNVPPGSMKSLLAGVIWPAYEWGPRRMMAKRYMSTSHKESLAIRDNLKCRRLITSEWYQGRWPVEMVDDQNAKSKFENQQTGFREAMAFGSMTGSRGDRVLLDDPISADDANSEVELESAKMTFLEALPTRVNNDKSAIVVIMQRLSERDTSGIIMDMDLPYVHLMLPMRFEEERRCYTVVRPTAWDSPPVHARMDKRTGLWYTDIDDAPEDRQEHLLSLEPQLVYSQDPRMEDGDLMFPDRFPRQQVELLEKTLGQYASAGQLQQRPAPRGGGIFQRDWFIPIKSLPSGCRFARGWDLAATPDASAPATAGGLLAKTPDNRIIIVDVRKERLSASGVEKLLGRTAADDEFRYGKGVRGSIPQDPGQAGKSQKSALISGPLMGRNYVATPETGDKETRARPLAAQAEAGNVYILEGDWNRDFLDEISVFPMGKFSDQVDAVSRAFSLLIDTPRWYSQDTYRKAYGGTETANQG